MGKTRLLLIGILAPTVVIRVFKRLRDSLTATKANPNYHQPLVSSHWETTFKYTICSGHQFIIPESVSPHPPSTQLHFSEDLNWMI